MISEVDDNPLDISVNVQKTLSAALSELSGHLAVAAEENLA